MAVVFALSVVTVSLGLVWEASTPAGADPIGECSTTVGEVVVVDFSHWGGSVVRGCDATLTTGYHALYAAGFLTQGTEEDGPGFICRIGLADEGASSEEPTPSQDACVNTPPATAYWSYWHADPGQNVWTYAQQGPLSYDPPPGSVDAWVFGASNVSGTDGRPTFPPSSVRATNTTPVASTTTSSPESTSTEPPSTTSPTSPGTTATSRPPVSAHHGGGGTTPTTGGHPGSSPPSSVATTLAHGATRARGDRSGKRGPPPSAETSGRGPSQGIVTIGTPQTVVARTSEGSPAVFAIGAGAVVAGLTAAAVIAWRRRRGPETS
jgi:hypothetical protein